MARSGRTIPVEDEVAPAEPAHEVLNADRRAQHPVPCKPGDDERDRQWIKEDRAKGALETDLAVQQHAEQHAKPERGEDVEHAKDEHVAPCDIPARRAEQPHVLDEARELVVRQHRRAGDREIRRPQGATVKAHDHQQHGRRQHRLRRQTADPHVRPFHRAASALSARLRGEREGTRRISDGEGEVGPSGASRGRSSTPHRWSARHRPSYPSRRHSRIESPDTHTLRFPSFGCHLPYPSSRAARHRSR